MARRPRTEMLGFRCTADEAAEIEKYATSEDQSTSEFVRAAVLAYLALRGSPLAWKRVGEGALATAVEFVARRSKTETSRT